jgi:hypothetical protein
LNLGISGGAAGVENGVGNLLHVGGPGDWYSAGHPYAVSLERLFEFVRARIALNGNFDLSRVNSRCGGKSQCDELLRVEKPIGGPEDVIAGSLPRHWRPPGIRNR